MLYADVYVDEPIEKIVDDWDFLNEKVLPKFMGFRPVGDGVYGMRQILPEAPQSVDQQQRGTGPVIAVENRRHYEMAPRAWSRQAHPACGARYARRNAASHRVRLRLLAHQRYGRDLDRRATGGRPARLCDPDPGSSEGKRGGSHSLVLRAMHELVYLSELVTGKLGIKDFWTWERTAVRAYNGDPKLRTCWSCGHVNPLGYLAASPPRTRPRSGSRASNGDGGA